MKPSTRLPILVQGHGAATTRIPPPRLTFRPWSTRRRAVGKRARSTHHHLNHAGPGEFTCHKVAKRLRGQTISCLGLGERQRQRFPLLIDRGVGSLSIKMGAARMIFSHRCTRSGSSLAVAP